MQNDTTHRLKTAAQIAEERLRAKRFDPAAYVTVRQGNVWHAFGPDRGIYCFRKAEDGETVLCLSSSGREYTLTMGEDLKRHCNCGDAQARQRESGCKHEVGFQAVKQAAAMARELGGTK
jgi:hypothetical protein